MPSGKKPLEHMHRNPQGDWRIGDVELLCRQFGVHCAAPSGGSHYKVSARGHPDILTIPARRPIKPIYIRKLVKFIDAVTGTGRSEE